MIYVIIIDFTIYYQMKINALYKIYDLPPYLQF